MDQPLSRLVYLFSRYAEDACTEAERAEFLYLVQQEENVAELNRLIDQAVESGIADREIRAHRADQIYNTVIQIPAEPESARGVVKTMFPWKRIVAAAAIILMLGAASYFFFFSNKKAGRELTATNPVPAGDVKAPRSNKATITLADGKRVLLDSVNKGLLAEQGNIKLVKLADGQIAYEGLHEPGTPGLNFNTLTNPRGSNVIDLTLSDGSRVWLNAGSSITYPIAFAGNERKVSITGEAYFEVSSLPASREGLPRAGGVNGKRSFIVDLLPSTGGAGGCQVEVLGTHFNVNAYDDEDAVRVTLLEGSVKVADPVSRVIIKPNEQASVSHKSQSSHSIQVRTVDVEAVMAWKNGLFVFDGYENIDAIMRQVARWYDVQVEYKGQVKTMFGGSISRSENVSQVLRMLEATGGVSFQVQDRKITVSAE